MMDWRIVALLMTLAGLFGMMMSSAVFEARPRVSVFLTMAFALLFAVGLYGLNDAYLEGSG